MSVQIIDREIERWKDDMSVFGGINLCDGCFIFLDLLHFSLTAVEFSGDGGSSVVVMMHVGMQMVFHLVFFGRKGF